MPAIYRHEHIVREDEIDEMGHVNNLEYLRWMQAAAIAHSSAQGWTADRYTHAGSAWVVRSHFIEYLQAAHAGEHILIATWVANFKKITSLRKFKIVRTDDDQLLARAETNWAYIGTKHYVPRRIPTELIESFQIVNAEEEP